MNEKAVQLVEFVKNTIAAESLALVYVGSRRVTFASVETVIDGVLFGATLDGRGLAVAADKITAVVEIHPPGAMVS